jgi:hypothetical protein
MTAAVTALAAPRRRFTGCVVVDVSGYVDGSGSLTRTGHIELWSGLAGACGLSVRLDIGALRHVPTASDALCAAFGCASVEVCGTDPDGVQDLVLWLRDHDMQEVTE